MKNLIPLLALLVFASGFSAPALAHGKDCEKKCEKGSDDCCKEGKSEKKSKKTKASADKDNKKEAEGEGKKTEESK